MSECLGESAMTRFIALDTTDRAAFDTLAAADTFRVFDHGGVAVDLNRAGFADAFALLASDAAVFAGEARFFAGGLGAAGDKFGGVPGAWQDHVLGAGTGAEQTANAFVRIDFGTTVGNGDRAVRADLCTVAESETTVQTRTAAAVDLR